MQCRGDCGCVTPSPRKSSSGSLAVVMDGEWRGIRETAVGIDRSNGHVDMAGTGSCAVL